MHEIVFREDPEVSKKYKEDYAEGIRRIISDRELKSRAIREQYVKEIFTDPDRYRKDLKSMLGWPLTEPRCREIPRAETVLLTEEGCIIERVTIEVMDGLRMTGLLFRTDRKPKPLVIAQHGGGGTPELISSLHGETYNYNRMVERMLGYGVDVFAPQLLLWNETYEVPYDRTALDAELKRAGGSATALEIYGLMRVLDYFESQGYPDCFGMIGLSYGGMFTLFAAALDTRIRSSVSSAYFRTHEGPVSIADWTYFSAARTFLDAEIACLVYPRRMCLQMGTQDVIESTRKEYERLLSLSSTVSGDWLYLVEFEGEHEFCRDDAPLKRVADDLYEEMRVKRTE